MDLMTFFAALAAVAAVATACIAFVALKPDQQERIRAASKTWVNRGMFLGAIGYSLLMIGYFWLSSAPLSKSGVFLTGLSFFNVAMWLGLALLAKMERGVDARRARIQALELRLATLEGRITPLEKPSTK